MSWSGEVADTDRKATRPPGPCRTVVDPRAAVTAPPAVAIVSEAVLADLVPVPLDEVGTAARTVHAGSLSVVKEPSTVWRSFGPFLARLVPGSPDTCPGGPRLAQPPEAMSDYK